MKLTHTIALLTALAVPHLVFAEEEDKALKFEELPPAVAKAIKEAAGEEKLHKITLGDEDGTQAYEATWKAKGHKHEIAVTKEGKVMSLEEIITAEEAPEAVRTAIASEAGGKKVLEVEKVLEKGKTFFEATYENGKGKLEVSFSEDGKVLERENPDAEKDEKGKKEKKD